MLIVSDEDFELERRKMQGTAPNISRTVIQRGRDNTHELPEELREVVAEIAIEEGTKAASEAFDISNSSIAAYKHGSTSTTTYHKNERVKARQRIADRVHTKLELAIDALTPDKISKVDKATELTTVMKDLASVTEKLTGRIQLTDEDKSKQVHLHLYGPPQKKIESYEIIDVTPE